MAKITANGATEVVKVRTIAPCGLTYLWAINSRGTILSRITGTLETGYTVYSRKNKPTRDALVKVINRRNHRITD